MKTQTFLAVAAALAGTAAAHPGMRDLMPSLLARQAAYAVTGGPVLIGDLATLPESELTPTGAKIRGLLLHTENPQDVSSTYTPPGPLGSDACAKDTCCVWSFIAKDLASAMVGDAGRCNSFARGCVRAGFHDAGTWSLQTGHPGGAGGATGSLVLAHECEDDSANNGLAETCATLRGYYAKYQAYGITMADLIQTASNVATVTCPLGPRVRTFVGRVDVDSPAPRGELPSPDDDADSLISRFTDKTIDPPALVALVGAHTTSQQSFFEPSRPNAPQDTTPGVWDVEFYDQTVQAQPPASVVRFPSDIALARDPRTNVTWAAFETANNGQAHWNDGYAQAYVRLSLLGVYNLNHLTECTQVLPPVKNGFTSPDQGTLSNLMAGLIAATTEKLEALAAGNKVWS